MSTIAVKPNPAKAFAATLKHPVSGGLLDHAGNVPDDGRPWLYDGFTCRMITDGEILLADDPVFAKAAADQPKADEAPKLSRRAPEQVPADANIQVTKSVTPAPSDSSVKPDPGR